LHCLRLPDLVLVALLLLLLPPAPPPVPSGHVLHVQLPARVHRHSIG
jgi:hypothetical protein